MKKIIIYTLLLTMVGLYGCLDDKNNYDYKQINALNKGKIYNMDDTYTLIVGEELTLHPTFELTIDKENPDVSYEWYLDGKKLDVSTPSHTFSFDKYGIYEVTYSIVDNKTGVKFSLSSAISVTSPYLRGWAVLSEMEGRSALSFIHLKIIKKPYRNLAGEDVLKDSIVYEQATKDLTPNLGAGPIRLLESTGHWDLSTMETGEILYDELVVMQKSKWVELNGNSLQKSLFTEDEFGGDVPAGFSPVEAVMTYSSKFILDANGYIYHSQKAVVNDFHAGFYNADPVWDKTKFKAMYGIYKFNDWICTVPVLTMDNSLRYIWDGGLTSSRDYPKIPVNKVKFSGNVYDIVDYDGVPDPRFQKMEYNILSLLPASTRKDSDYDICPPRWVALMEKGGNYFLRNFALDTYYVEPPVAINEMDGIYLEKSINASMFSNYKENVVFNNKQYVVIASGSDLWYCSTNKRDTGIKIELEGGQSLPAEIVSISSFDADATLKSMYDNIGLNGHLGVALANGEFRIYEIIEHKQGSTVNKVTLKQLYPNAASNSHGNNHFGKIVDAIYKYGDCLQMTIF